MQSIFFFRLSSFSSPSTLILSLRATYCPPYPLFSEGRGVTTMGVWTRVQLLASSPPRFPSVSVPTAHAHAHMHTHTPPAPLAPISHLASLSRTRSACTVISIYFVYGRALKCVESLYTFGRFGFCLHADLPAIFGCWWRALYHFYNVCCFLFSFSL